MTPSSIHETGHAKNVAALESLNSFCTAYGAAYNPSKVTIKIAALNTLLTTCRNSLIAVNTAITAHSNSVNARKISFKPLEMLATRIIYSLEATDAKKETVEDAKAILRKIQGRRAKPLPKLAEETTGTAPQAPAPVTISVSQLSFDNRIENFSKLLLILQSEPLYVPNENDLKTATLNAFLTTLKTNNTAVINNYTVLRNARMNRNKLLYADFTGLHDIAMEVKKYVKSLYGTNTPEYKQISKIKFTRYKQ